MAKNDDRISSSSGDKDEDGQHLNSRDREFALKYYEIMLGALGSRERQVIQMFAYVAPAMVAMAWLVTMNNPLLLLGGSCTLAVILAHARQHIVRMAYNFRTCMLQAGEIEEVTGWKRYVLARWIKRTKEPPDDFLPEMFKSQVQILRIVMWTIIIVGSFAILESTGRCFYYWFCKRTPWPKSDCYQLEHVLPGLAAVGLVILGAWMEWRCSTTLKRSDHDLRKTYDCQNKRRKDSHTACDASGDVPKDANGA